MIFMAKVHKHVLVVHASLRLAGAILGTRMVSVPARSPMNMNAQLVPRISARTKVQPVKLLRRRYPISNSPAEVIRGKFLTEVVFITKAHAKGH